MIISCENEHDRRVGQAGGAGQAVPIEIAGSAKLINDRAN
jgi:hypothetical protein